MGDADLLRRAAQRIDEEMTSTAPWDSSWLAALVSNTDAAEALAAWLRAEANTTGRCAARHMRITARAEAFARAILGEVGA